MNDYGQAGGDILGGAGAGAAFGPYGAAAGGLLGLGKYAFLDRPNYQRQLALAASTARYSPWTHLTAQVPQTPDPFSNALAFGAAGAQIGKQFSTPNAPAPQGSQSGLNFGTVAQPQVFPNAVAPQSMASSTPQDSYQDFYKSYLNSYDNNMGPNYNLRRAGA